MWACSATSYGPNNPSWDRAALDESGESVKRRKCLAFDSVETKPAGVLFWQAKQILIMCSSYVFQFFFFKKIFCHDIGLFQALISPCRYIIYCFGYGLTNTRNQIVIDHLHLRAEGSPDFILLCKTETFHSGMIWTNQHSMLAIILISL